MNTTAIAQHLNIAETLIAKVEEWAHVLFVRFTSGRPRLVSKKVVKNMSLEEAQSVYGDPEAIQRNYINEKVVSAAYAVAKALQEAGMAHFARDKQVYFPATWDVIDPCVEELKGRQRSACFVIAAHLLGA